MISMVAVQLLVTSGLDHSFIGRHVIDDDELTPVNVLSHRGRGQAREGLVGDLDQNLLVLVLGPDLLGVFSFELMSRFGVQETVLL